MMESAMELENQIEQEQPKNYNNIPPQSIQAFKSETQIGIKRQKSLLDGDDALVITNKVTSRVKTDRIQKIWEEFQKSDQTPRLTKKQQSIPSITKRTSIAHQKKALQANVSQKAVQRIGNLMDKYKFANTTKFIQPAQKIRAELKQRLVNVFLYGIQQLRQTNLELSDYQRSLLQQLSKGGQLEKARKLALQIQIQLLKYCNRGFKTKIQKPYKDKASIVLTNLRDDSNFELRRKLLNGKMSAVQIANAKQIELYTQARRDEIISKSRNLMAQSTLQVKQMIIQEEMVTLQKIKEQKQQIKLVAPVRSKYLNEKLTDELWDMVGLKQLNKFYDRLKNDLPEKQANILILSLNDVFNANFQQI